MKVIVIIPAAGLGTRMASASRTKHKKPAPSKQFTELKGVPILIHTLMKFARHPHVNQIIVALRKDEMAGFQARLEKEAKEILVKNVRFVEGGEHRQHSVANALNTLTADDNDIVLIHDAVRPLVTPEIIDEVIAAAEKTGAAIAGLPAVDTVKQVDRTSEGAVIATTIPREKIVMAQTPQAFHYSVLKKIFSDAAADGFLGTDEASLAERAGVPVAVVMGSPSNIKITTPADLDLAAFYLGKS